MPTIRTPTIFLSALLASTLACAEPPTDASIDALMQVTRMEAMVNNQLRTIDQDIKQNLQKIVANDQLSDAQRQKLNAIFQKMGGIVRDEMAWDKMRPLYLQIYRESLTAEELNGMLAFYNTPAGKAMVEKMPLILEKSVAVSREQVMPRVMQQLIGLRSEIAEVLGGKTQ